MPLRSRAALSKIALLTNIAEVFSVPTKTFLGYELKVQLPYFLKTSILRKKGIPKPAPIIEKADSGSDEDVLTA